MMQILPLVSVLFGVLHFHFIFNFLDMVAPQLEKTDLQGTMQ